MYHALGKVIRADLVDSEIRPEREEDQEQGRSQYVARPQRQESNAPNTNQLVHIKDAGDGAMWWPRR